MWRRNGRHIQPSSRRGKPLLQPERHEAEFAIGPGHQQERGLAAVLLQLVDLGLEFVSGRDRFLGNLDDHVARTQPLVGR